MSNPSGGKTVSKTAGATGPKVPEHLRVLRVALFGLGRAGTIHLGNIIGNPRIELAYIVEADTGKWQLCKEQWNLKTVIFLEPKVNSNITKVVFIKTVAYKYFFYLRRMQEKYIQTTQYRQH